MSLSELFGLSGRGALVTGGSRGLGKAMATALAEAGADVMIVSRHENELAAAAKEIAADKNVKVRYAVVDMLDRAAIPRLAERATKELGRVDILVNNAGSNNPQPIDQITDEAWDNLIELNLSSCMALSRAVAPQMKERRWGRIIHISSIMALASKEARNAYSATKAGLIGMAMASAQDLAPWSITVNCICPGPFVTELTTNLLSAEQKKTFSDRTALGRWGQPRELAGPLLLLASDAGSYITGATLVVDGGVLCKTF